MLDFEHEPCVMATISDVTERKHAEVMYRTLFETSADAIMMLDDMTFIDCNAATLRMFGCSSREAFVGKHPSELSPHKQPCGSDSMSLANEMIAKAFRRGRHHFEWVHARQDGSIFPADVLLTLLTLDGRKVLQATVRDITDRKQIEQINEKTSEILEMAISEQPVSDIYDAICLMFEDRYPGMRASILKLRGNQLFHGGAPHLPDTYMAAIDGTVIGPRAGSCGTAAFLGEQVIVENIATDPLWDDYKGLALPHGLQSCWSEPVKDASHCVLGTFAMYYDHPCKPDEKELLDIRRAAGLAALVMERENREASLRNLLEAIEQLNESIMLTDRNGMIEYVNAAFTKITGYSATEAMGKTPGMLNSGKQDAGYYERMWKTILSGEIWKGKVIDRRKDGSFLPVMLTVSPIVNKRGEITHFVGVHDDISAIKKLEESFYQAQKMEAIGTLAGGIAHDFNNMLAGMIGTVYLVRDALKDHPEAQEKLKRVEKTGFRAADMISHLLTFARKGMADVQPLALTPFLKETFKLARSSVPENISFTLDVPATGCTVQGDATLLQQVLLNLVTNARYAAAGQTHPEIRISLNMLGANEALWERHSDLPHKPYARLTVKDNGCGIPKEHFNKLFDPFFTTKGVGKGTGLGLAMVYGAVQSHEGVIEVESEEGKGSSFHVFLPLIEQTEVTPQAAQGQVMEGHGESILLADDEKLVCEVSRELLESMGYRVLIATNGEEAVRLFGVYQDEIRLVILDVVMPQLGGVDAALRMRAAVPDLPILFQTGYGEEQVQGEMESLKDCHVVTKPASIPELSRLLRELLDGGP